jgi:hypothetical protein
MAYLTLLIIYQLKLLYNNHSHNHRKYEGLSSINIKDFLRQDKKIIIENNLLTSNLNQVCVFVCKQIS